MKDYYQILNIPENASPEQIKRAFRRLAFKHHPDTNPGNERQAEASFKEINEAYGVLGDRTKRQQYDYARQGQFAGYGTGYQGFSYSQQDIFRDIFTNRAAVDELNRMFSQAGLRFDQDFMNRVFFSGRGFGFNVFTQPAPGKEGDYRQPDSGTVTSYKPGLMERLLIKIMAKIGKFIFKCLFGLAYELPSSPTLDRHQNLEISGAEAAAGGEQPVVVNLGSKIKRIMVKIPAGIRSGTKIRLKGMGSRDRNKRGDLYLHIRVRS